MFRNAASQQGRGFRSHWGLFCVEFFQAPEVGANKLTSVATVVCLPCILRNTALKPMIVVVNGWSRGNRAVIYNINSITPCWDRKCNRMLFVPPPIVHLLLGDAAFQAGGRWPVSVCGWLTRRSGGEQHYGHGGESAPVAAAALLCLHTSRLITAHRRMMLTEAAEACVCVEAAPHTALMGH